MTNQALRNLRVLALASTSDPDLRRDIEADVADVKTRLAAADQENRAMRGMLRDERAAVEVLENTVIAVRKLLDEAARERVTVAQGKESKPWHIGYISVENLRAALET